MNLTNFLNQNRKKRLGFLGLCFSFPHLTHYLMDKSRHADHMTDPPHSHMTGHMMLPMIRFYIRHNSIHPTFYKVHHQHSDKIGHMMLPIIQFHIRRNSVRPPPRKAHHSNICHRFLNSPNCWCCYIPKILLDNSIPPPHTQPIHLNGNHSQCSLLWRIFLVLVDYCRQIVVSDVPSILFHCRWLRYFATHFRHYLKRLNHALSRLYLRKIRQTHKVKNYKV